MYKLMEKKPFKVDRNGTQYFYDWTCPRCGGEGGRSEWTYTGWTCFECGGTGRSEEPKIVKVYTPEWQARIDARRQAKAEAEAVRIAEEEARLERIRKEQEELARLAEERRQAEEKAKKAISQYVGEVGQKLTVTATYMYSAHYTTHVSWLEETIYVHRFKDAWMNTIIWKTQKGLPQGIEEGDLVTITGTVKAHDEYKDEKQTALIRRKIKKED